MDDLLIENVDDELLRKVDEAARVSGRDIEQEAIRLIELGLSVERRAIQDADAVSAFSKLGT